MNDYCGPGCSREWHHKVLGTLFGLPKTLPGNLMCFVCVGPCAFISVCVYVSVCMCVSVCFYVLRSVSVCVRVFFEGQGSVNG